MIVYLAASIPRTSSVSMIWFDIVSEKSWDIFKGIYTFITGRTDFNKDIEIPFLKQNIYSLEEQIENYKEVCYKLNDDPYFLAALEIDRCKSPYESP